MPSQSTSSTLTWQEAGKVVSGTDEFAELESLVRQHARLIFKVAYGVLRNSHDAEDVVQEVFLRVHRTGVKDVIDVPAWLAQIAFRLAIDRTRKPHEDELGDVETAGSEPDAESVAIHREQVAMVQRLIAALPDELRQALLLSAVEELNSRQIADVLGTSEASVRGRIFRARQLLKEKLSALTEKKL